MQTKNNNILASLDIGSNKIVCLIGYINFEEKLFIKGVAHQEARGIKDGEVNDIKLLTRSIISTISYAEKIAGINIEDIILNVSGNNIKSSLIKLETLFDNEVITKSSVINLVSQIENVAKEQKKEVIHLIPISYCVNNIEMENPFDINAESLKIVFNTIMVDKIKIENLKNCLKRTPLKIAKFAFTPYMSAIGCLSPQEMENGSLVIDLGAGNSSFAVMHKGNFIYSGSISLAGNNITEEIAKTLNIDFETAEKIKVKNVNLCLDEYEENELIKIDIDTDNDYYAAQNKKKLINTIFKNKVQDIILIIMGIMTKKNLIDKIQQVVITGGGSCVIGVDLFINDLINIETKIGIPDFNLLTNNNIEIKKLKNPIYSCAIGLLIYFSKTTIVQKIQEYQNKKKNKFISFIDYLIKLFIS